MRINAKQEILDNLGYKYKILAAEIIFYENNERILHLDYTDKEFADFLNEMDFEYWDNGAFAYGIIWLTDGSFLERRYFRECGFRWHRVYIPDLPKRPYYQILELRYAFMCANIRLPLYLMLEIFETEFPKITSFEIYNILKLKI